MIMKRLNEYEEMNPGELKYLFRIIISSFIAVFAIELTYLYFEPSFSPSLYDVHIPFVAFDLFIISLWLIFVIRCFKLLIEVAKENPNIKSSKEKR